jgi:hypothetical protein
MPGPWERYQQPSQPHQQTSGKPWERYGGQPTIATAAPPTDGPSIGDQVKRTVGLNARSLAEGAMGVVAPFADATGYLLNKPIDLYDKATGSETKFRFPTDHGAQFSQDLSNVGLPKPETGAEKFGDIASQFLTGGAAGAPLTAAFTKGPAAARATAAALSQSKAASPAAQTLENAGVSLDRSQRGGGRFMQMLRSAVTNHPITAGKQYDFSVKQQQEFNRAVLRSIGADASEATQPVMLAAKRRIGSVFDSIGRKGAAFDDALQTELAEISDDATRTVTKSSMDPVKVNIDDILAAVDDTGRISGEQFIKIRRHLSDLSDNPDVGQVAQKIENALLSALERTHPGEKQLLRDAADQWRSMRIIQGALGKGAERNVSPLALSNAIANKQNQAMSVYGQGGDQGLVSLAQAGRSTLPEALPDSGSIPRGMMQAPLRALATAPLYKAAQAYLLSGGNKLPAGGGVRTKAALLAQGLSAATN